MRAMTEKKLIWMRRVPRPGRAIAGVTLVEMLFGGAILLASLTALVGALVSLNAASGLARNRTEAINDANMILEELRNRQAHGISLPLYNVGTTIDRNWLLNVKTNVSRNLLPNEDVTFSSAPINGDSALQRIAIQVAWNDRGGRPFVQLVGIFKQPQ